MVFPLIMVARRYKAMKVPPGQRGGPHQPLARFSLGSVYVWGGGSLKREGFVWGLLEQVF